jgi:hypothetical protein
VPRGGYGIAEGKTSLAIVDTEPEPEPKPKRTPVRREWDKPVEEEIMQRRAFDEAIADGALVLTRAELDTSKED